MKKVKSSIILLCVSFLLSCSKEHTIFPESPEAIGALQVSINMGKVGALRKTMKSTQIDMTKLYIVFSAEGQSPIFDTLTLTGGSQERTERKTYGNVAAWKDGYAIEWTLSAEARDKNGILIYSGDTVFTIHPDETTEIPLFLKSKYSMLKVNFFPIRDSVTRCKLNVDGGPVEADSTFPIQSLIGDTVSLSYDYLTASSFGVSHHIKLNVYGKSSDGIDTLLYTGDTTILVQSGEDKKYRVLLNYVGHNTLHGAATMVVTLGEVGTTKIDGVLFPDHFPEGLILWNKLGSLQQIENSEVGVNGKIIPENSDILFSSVKFGDGLKVNTTNEQTARVYFSFDQTSPNDAWTVEMWHKPEHNSDYTGIARWTGVGEKFGQSGYLGPYWYWRGWDNCLCFCVYDGPIQLMTTESADINNSLISFEADDLIHVAVIMDRNGIDGTSDIYRFYWNGVLAKSWTTATSINYSAHLKFAGVGFGGADYLPMAFSDNIKIYNYAKTDFSDRFTE